MPFLVVMNNKSTNGNGCIYTCKELGKGAGAFLNKLREYVSLTFLRRGGLARGMSSHLEQLYLLHFELFCVPNV